MGGRRVKIVALGVAVGLAVAGAAVAQTGAVSRGKDSALFVKADFKSAPAAARSGDLRTSPRMDAAAKPAPYIYKAPMATRPIKTW